MGRVVLTVFAVGWGLFGVACFAAPAAMLRGFGIALSGADAVTEIRAMYGGAQLGLAAFFAYASRKEALFKPALILAALIMSGSAAARVGGIVLDGSTGALTIGSVAFEVLVVCVAVFASRRLGSSAPMSAP
jgi:hypothetical protein